MRIAFFDSGLGGITVLHEAMKRLPKENFLYFADTLHVPYGTKSKEEVDTYVKSSVAAIHKEGVKAIVIACNTGTSISILDLRRMYDIPIIGMEPAVKPALEFSRSTGKRVLVLATPLTLKQAKYTELVSRIDDQSLVDSLPLPELVGFCEQLNFDRNVISEYFSSKLAAIDLSLYGVVVLGCTHYIFYKDILREIVPHDIQIIDGNAGTVNRLLQVLRDRDQLNAHGNGSITFMCSSNNQEYMWKMEKALEVLRGS